MPNQLYRFDGIAESLTITRAWFGEGCPTAETQRWRNRRGQSGAKYALYQVVPRAQLSLDWRDRLT